MLLTKFPGDHLKDMIAHQTQCLYCVNEKYWDIFQWNLNLNEQK